MDYMKRQLIIFLKKQYKIKESYGYWDIYSGTGSWMDYAVYFKNNYLDKLPEHTIFGQMLLIKKEIDQLTENRQSEKQGIEDEIDKKRESYNIREQYIKSKKGDMYDIWCSEQEKLILTEFIKEEKRKCEIGIQKLQEEINRLQQSFAPLAEEWNYYQSSTYGDEITRREEEIAKDIQDSKDEIENERSKIEELRKSGEEICM